MGINDPSIEPNYFTCTLSEAESHPRPYHSVNHLLETQAKQRPNDAAIGFYQVVDQEATGRLAFEPQVLTFAQVHKCVVHAAKILQQTLSLSSGQTIGLLCSSSAQFLFTWLGVIRLGCPVLLIDPQCSATAVRGLCEATGCDLLLVDEKNRMKGEDVAALVDSNDGNGLKSSIIPVGEDEIFEYARSDTGCRKEEITARDAEPAYYHHTSGTSSGTPKPIPQSQKGAIGALPSLNGSHTATFATTPLYHGGPADLFRAWSSGAMIWFFPSRDAPITASNVLACLECARSAERENEAPPIRYFTAVPYIIERMSEDDRGLKVLQNMDLVGVGGAALPVSIGDRLVEAGVRLVSRFGSAECGFLLSSHRDYQTDKEWQYLRVPETSTRLAFEPREDGQAELIVLPTWPHMAKRNRRDGSFATSDLFVPHAHLPNAWKYHSRADAQITLITGKKFDPSPIEGALVSSTSLVSNVLVFGSGRPYPGALVFRSVTGRDMPDNEVIDAVSNTLTSTNAQSAAHARISKSSLIPMPYSEQPLAKSSKGTIMRKQAEERYQEQIEGFYRKEDQFDHQSEVTDSQVPEALKCLICSTLGTDAMLSDDQDLFAFGVDSVAGMQIRHRLRSFLPRDAPRLPGNVIEDCRTVRCLAEYLQRARNGDTTDSTVHKEEGHSRMLRLVDECSHFIEAPQTTERSIIRHDSGTEGEVVLLTGATGSLGAHVLHTLLNKPNITKIYCLTRGSSVHAARERVDKALQQRQLGNLEQFGKVEVLTCTLGDAHLGLDASTYSRLAEEVTCILHVAWVVNFRMGLESFVKDSISSVTNLINLALAAPTYRECPRFIFCSSVASVMNIASKTSAPETIVNDPSSATGIGYSQSKWIAEQICSRAAGLPCLHDRISILRIGQLSGDSKTGIWNAKEAWPMMLSSVKVTGSLPDLRSQVLDWLPVDGAARAVVQAMTAACRAGDVAVYHVLNEHRTAMWSDLIRWLAESREFDVVEPLQWIETLDRLVEEGSDHPSLQLLDHWREAYKTKGENSVMTFEMKRSREALPILMDVKPIDRAYFEKLWAWIDRTL